MRADSGAALPMIDYEDAFPPDLDAAYRAEAGSFEDRGSAVMMASTHAARQLFRMEAEAPSRRRRGAHYLNVAQYWAWWLSGVAGLGDSAMGAQSHLWNVPSAASPPSSRGTRLDAADAALPPGLLFARAGPPALRARFGLPEASPC
jgi:sugar (pentulose or hexulose) kinase